MKMDGDAYNLLSTDLGRNWTSGTRPKTAASPLRSWRRDRGGICLNRGCIPSKKQLYQAKVMETVDRADEFGIYTEVTDVEIRGLLRFVGDADLR